MKSFIILLFIISIFSSCSIVTSHRGPASIEIQSENSCTTAFNHFAIRSLSPKRRAQRFYSQRVEAGLPVHLDLGGEGRYRDAINVNPNAYTSTTGEPGRVIPFWVEGRSDQIPFPSNSVDKITIENAPISGDSIKEMLRVLRPRGDIHLSHPVDYALVIHQLVMDAFPDAVISQKNINTNIVTKIRFTSSD